MSSEVTEFIWSMYFLTPVTETYRDIHTPFTHPDVSRGCSHSPVCATQLQGHVHLWTAVFVNQENASKCQMWVFTHHVSVEVEELRDFIWTYLLGPVQVKSQAESLSSRTHGLHQHVVFTQLSWRWFSRQYMLDMFISEPQLSNMSM